MFSSGNVYPRRIIPVLLFFQDLGRRRREREKWESKKGVWSGC